MSTENPWGDIGNGDTIYAWQVLDRRDNAWGLISMMIPSMGISAPLVARSIEHATCDEYREIAEWHQRNTGEPIRLAKFTLDEVVEER